MWSPAEGSGISDQSMWVLHNVTRGAVESGGHYLPQSRTSASDEKQRSPLASTGSERRRAAESGGREMTESDPKWSGHVDAC